MTKRVKRKMIKKCTKVRHSRSRIHPVFGGTSIAIECRMTNKFLRFFAVLYTVFIIVLFQSGAVAEDSPNPPDDIPMLKPRSAPGSSLKPKKRARRLAAVESETSVSKVRVQNPNYPSTNDDNFFRIGALGGVSSLSSGNLSQQALITGAGTGQNIYLGLNGDFRHQFYGAEFDGFYGLGSGSASTAASIIGSSSSTTSASSLQQYGGLIDAKVQYPFRTGAIKWIPKLGIGYGLVGLLSSASGSSVSGNYQVGGVFATGGFDVEPTSFLIFQADYALSLFANGTYSNGTTLYPGSSANFDRLRFGAYYRIFSSGLLGAQFIQRSMNITFPTSAAQSQLNSQSQFLGVFMYQL
jgi:hypothetical protein